MWDNYNICNVHMTGMPEGYEKEKETEKRERRQMKYLKK